MADESEVRKDVWFNEQSAETNSRRRELGQTTSEYTTALTVISGTSVFLFTGLSSQVAPVVTSVVRLLP